MDKNLEIWPKEAFNYLNIIKKEQLTHDVFLLELAVPEDLEGEYSFRAGQYVSFYFGDEDKPYKKDYSMVSAPHEKRLVFGIKLNAADSSSRFLYRNYGVGDRIAVSRPKGRFILPIKPHEFRTIIGFATGIGITPVLSHFRAVLHSEPRTRLYLFYGNKTPEDVAFKKEIDEMSRQFSDRFEVYYFYSRDSSTGLFSGRLDANKLKLIINQILHLDDTDEESTIWDSVDDVLICGKGEMIKEIANACYDNGIPKKNIHFELFAEFNEDIYHQEVDFPRVENITVEFQMNDKNYETTLPNNQTKILQQLLIQGFEVPYSCKSGICGSCVCTLQEGEVELLENEYLTEKEAAEGKILACMSIPLTKVIKLNFNL